MILPSNGGHLVEHGSPDAGVTQALNLATGTLAAEAAEAAGRVVAEGTREADAQVAAAEGLRTRAEAAAAAESDLARERAFGRVETLEARADEVRDELLAAGVVAEAIADPPPPRDLSNARTISTSIPVTDASEHWAHDRATGGSDQDRSPQHAPPFS